NSSLVSERARNYNTGLTKLVIGQEISATTSGYMTMDVAAFLIYDRALSASEHADVTAYLQNKYFSTTPAASVEITSPADGATFPSGAVVNFTGTAINADDQNISSTIAWSSDVSG